MTDSRDDACGSDMAGTRAGGRPGGRGDGAGDGAAGGGIDLSGAPLAYPGRIIPRSVRLRVLDGSEEPLDPDAARHGYADRTPVLAVGSNASAGVMLWKLRRGGAGGEVPLVRARVRNLLVAPSAHVARAGFVPAAPAHVDGAVSEVVIGWLDRVQLDCVDRTEPNYRRVDLAAGDYPLEPRSVVPIRVSGCTNRCGECSGTPEPHGCFLARPSWPPGSPLVDCHRGRSAMPPKPLRDWPVRSIYACVAGRRSEPPVWPRTAG